MTEYESLEEALANSEDVTVLNLRESLAPTAGKAELELEELTNLSEKIVLLNNLKEIQLWVNYKDIAATERMLEQFHRCFQRKITLRLDVDLWNDQGENGYHEKEDRGLEAFQSLEKIEYVELRNEDGNLIEFDDLDLEYHIAEEEFVFFITFT